MTSHVHAPVLKPRSEIAAQAREFHPLRFTVRMLSTSVSAVFVGIGLVVGTLWFAVVFTALLAFNRVSWFGQCMRYGFHKGARHKLVPKE